MAVATGLASTVVLLRDASDGAEVLLLERPHDRGSYRGAWVFPGGAVDAEDADGAADDESAARRAAVRETVEETALSVTEHELTPLARWRPPAEAPKPLVTWFFAAVAPDAPIALNPVEAVAYAWRRPADALDAHARGTMTLFPPTWLTLHGLAVRPAGASVAELIDAVRADGRAEFATRFGPERRSALWQGDVAYADDALIDAAGPRHRLEMDALPWRYVRTDGDDGDA